MTPNRLQSMLSDLDDNFIEPLRHKRQQLDEDHKALKLKGPRSLTVYDGLYNFAVTFRATLHQAIRNEEELCQSTKSQSSPK